MRAVSVPEVTPLVPLPDVARALFTVPRVPRPMLVSESEEVVYDGWLGQEL
jgi:hypothetical protein